MVTPRSPAHILDTAPKDQSTTRSGRVFSPYVDSMTDSVVTVAPALPTFAEKTPRAWFMLAESRFKINKLTTDDDKVC